MARNKPKGWRHDSARHALAAKGIKTKVVMVPLRLKDVEPLDNVLDNAADNFGGMLDEDEEEAFNRFREAMQKAVRDTYP